MNPQLAVIFDVDGVLTDSYRPHYRSWQRMFAEHDITFTDEEFRRTFGRTNRDILTTLYPGKLSDDEIRRWGDRKEELYREIIAAEFEPMPGAVELIDALFAAGFKLGVGSSGPPANIRVTLDKLGRAGRFSAIVTGADVERGKPDPQVFLLAGERLGVPPARCAVIEDAPQGVEAANRAGMTSIGLTDTTTHDKLSHAKLVVDRLGDLSPEKISTLIDQNS